MSTGEQHPDTMPEMKRRLNWHEYIVLALAIWGAALSTIVAVRQYAEAYREQPKVSIAPSKNPLIADSGKEPDRLPFLLINAGFKPVVVMNVNGIVEIHRSSDRSAWMLLVDFPEAPHRLDSQSTGTIRLRAPGLTIIPGPARWQMPQPRDGMCIGVRPLDGLRARFDLTATLSTGDVVGYKDEVDLAREPWAEGVSRELPTEECEAIKESARKIGPGYKLVPLKRPSGENNGQ